LNEVKTRLKDARRERFEFLGYSFGLHRHRRDGKPYLGASPSTKSVAQLKRNVREHLRASHVRPWPDIRHGLNAILRGWDTFTTMAGPAPCAMQTVSVSPRNGGLCERFPSRARPGVCGFTYDRRRLTDRLDGPLFERSPKPWYLHSFFGF